MLVPALAVRKRYHFQARVVQLCRLSLAGGRLRAQVRRFQGPVSAAADVEVDMELGLADAEAKLEKDLEAGELEAQDRLAQTMELLSEYSTEKHPGHQPGRFGGPGPEYDGMEYDPKTGRYRMAEVAGPGDGAEQSTALATLSEADRYLVTRFEHEGGLALALSNAFRMPDRLRGEAKKIIRRFDAERRATEEGRDPVEARYEGEDEEAPGMSEEEINAALIDILETAGLREAENLIRACSKGVEKALVMFQAADYAEEREAVMRNVWSDTEFNSGEEDNAELVTRLEMQFANQLVTTTEARLAAEAAAKRAAAATAEEEAAAGTAGGAAAETAALVEERAEGEEELWQPDAEWQEKEQAEGEERSKGDDAIFSVALRDCQNVGDLALKLSAGELDATLLEPRNLGVALDLVGVYLKNYEIDKADLVITRIVPLCRIRGGTWLCKGLDKLSAVRMKQFRAYDALAAMKEIEQLVPFKPPEGWEFHDILFRNQAWCYSSLDEAEKTLEYTRKSMEVKKASGIPASWFDIWDLGKAHARLGQKTDQVKEMKVAYDLILKSGEIHRECESHDRVMLAKICANVGEVAIGVGDFYHQNGNEDEAHFWYEKAEPSLREAYDLHVGALGPMKPLAGWAAGTVAHCLTRLEKYEEARDFLSMAWKVECTKDSTTPGSVIELLDRVVALQQQLEDLPGVSRYLDDMDMAIQGLKARNWDRKDRAVFALLLQRASTARLISDNGTGDAIPRVLQDLREAESHLVIHLGHEARSHRCQFCGSAYESEDDLEAHKERRHAGVLSAEGLEAVDVERKQFGPREDPEELLKSIRTSLRLLSITESVLRQGGGSGEGNQEPRFEELRPEEDIEDLGTASSRSSASGWGADPEEWETDDDGGAGEGFGALGAAFEVRRGMEPFCTRLRVEPTSSREEHVFMPDGVLHDGERVTLERLDNSGQFGHVSCRTCQGWVQLKYLIGFSGS